MTSVGIVEGFVLKWRAMGGISRVTVPFECIMVGNSESFKLDFLFLFWLC